jgi:hypothetical protein
MAFPLLSQVTITLHFKCIKLGEDKHNRHLEIENIRNFYKAKRNIPLPVPRLKKAFSAPEIGR